MCPQLDQSHHLIGEELLELVEKEVPPEDVVFHRFYMNKTGPIKPKAKKKTAFWMKILESSLLMM